MTDLEQRARDLLAQASVIAEAPGSSYVPKGRRAYGSKDPSGDPGSLHDQMRRRFATANGSLAEAVEWAEKELQLRRVGQKRADLTTKEGRLELGQVDGHARQVAWRYCVSVDKVYRCRREAREVLEAIGER